MTGSSQYSLYRATACLCQTLFALNLGRKTDATIVNRLRHLRRLGVPFAGGEDRGQGNRVRYDFDHLVETGAALFALHNNMPARDISQWFGSNRKLLRKASHQAWAALPEKALEQDWIKKRGGTMASDEIYFRLHDRHSQKDGTFDFVRHGDLVDVLKTGFVGERFDDQHVAPDRRIFYV